MIEPKVAPPTAREAAAARAAVRVRSGGICEGCGIRPATEMHHRLYRSRGGLDTAENFLHLCGGAAGMYGGNHSGCHGTAHTLIGEHLGWSVRSGNDPAEVPVFHRLTGSWTIAGVLTLAASAVDLMVAFGQIRAGVTV